MSVEEENLILRRAAAFLAKEASPRIVDPLVVGVAAEGVAAVATLIRPQVATSVCESRADPKEALLSDSYSSQYRYMVLVQARAGRSMSDPAEGLDASAATIYRWKKQDEIDAGDVFV
ncbi:hypothetical protein [Ilumatobacter sp.]|uniref:hypothetical protein n=1 Tax=Ilumatobacter sp. TaxID=1967498 RepID=UPI003753664F